MLCWEVGYKCQYKDLSSGSEEYCTSLNSCALYSNIPNVAAVTGRFDD